MIEYKVFYNITTIETKLKLINESVDEKSLS